MPNYKVVDADQLDTDMKSVADSIRSKGGTADSLVFPDGFISAVEDISTGADSSGATAGEYDIYTGKTVFVDNKELTGAYDYQGHGGDSQWSANSDGCSSTELVIPVPFEPKGCCLNLNSGSYNSNTIVSADFRLGNVATYHTYRGNSSGMYRNQYTSNISNYISYDSSTKKLTIKSPNSSYKFSTNNYRVLIFR